MSSVILLQGYGFSHQKEGCMGAKEGISCSKSGPQVPWGYFLPAQCKQLVIWGSEKTP